MCPIFESGVIVGILRRHLKSLTDIDSIRHQLILANCLFYAAIEPKQSSNPNLDSNEKPEAAINVG